MTSFCTKSTEGIVNPVALADMIELSKVLNKEVEDYRHSNYQSAMAGIAISKPKLLTVVVAPTGSGKTWV